MATGFGFGFSPILPGTVGALWGLPLALAILWIPSLAGQIAVVAVLFVLSAPVCGRASIALGGKKDPGAIVLDEIASLPIVFFAIAPERLGAADFAAADWRIWAAGFVLHRIFDIAKPPPIGYAERLPGGWGIVADDTLAAIAAGAALYGLDLAGLFV